MAKLTVVEGPDCGCEFQIPKEDGTVLSVGRDPRNVVALSDGSVSREHLRIEFNGRDFRLVDLGSKNRTYLNSEPIRESLLRNGDLIGLGDSELRFEEEQTQASREDHVESTIMAELSVEGGKTLEGMLQEVSTPDGPRGERLGKALASIRRLLRLPGAMAKSKSADDFYRELLKILVPALMADHMAVLVPSAKRWVIKATREKEPSDNSKNSENQENRVAVVSETIVKKAATEKKAILSTDTRKDERFLSKDSVIDASIASSIAAPILSSGEGGEGGPAVVAVLYADRRGMENPFTEEELKLLVVVADQAIGLVSRLDQEAELRAENKVLLRSISESKRIIGRSRQTGQVLEFIRRAAPAHQTILIRGETGTGKELVAAAIHYQGPRKGKPFMAINCASIPENLIESELFGHERGAFTGAVSRRKGRFELANGGSVFLDEIGELSLTCQAKILRLLEDRRFERLGGSQVIEVDVRIIAATNKDLARAISSNEFREDLFYRLNVLGISLAPLRERSEDIAPLARHFLQEMGAHRELTAGAEEKLRSHPWPGNVRQLRNVIESAVVMGVGDGPEISPEELVLPPPGEGRTEPSAWAPISLEELQRHHILKVLEYTGGNKKRAADILGIERCTLYAKLKALGKKAGQGADGQRSKVDSKGRKKP